nr:hypothetical protein [Mycoplasmopsis bovis]
MLIIFNSINKSMSFDSVILISGGDWITKALSKAIKGAVSNGKKLIDNFLIIFFTITP